MRVGAPCVHGDYSLRSDVDALQLPHSMLLMKRPSSSWGALLHLRTLSARRQILSRHVQHLPLLGYSPLEQSFCGARGHEHSHTAYQQHHGREQLEQVAHASPICYQMASQPAARCASARPLVPPPHALRSRCSRSSTNCPARCAQRPFASSSVVEIGKLVYNNRRPDAYLAMCIATFRTSPCTLVVLLQEYQAMRT